MLSFLKSKQGTPVPEPEVLERYNRWRWQALFGIFIGYAAYYILRNNFLLSSPELISEFGFTKKDIGLISGTMLVVYGLSKGVMSALADKSNPKHFMIFGLMMSAAVNLMMGFTASFWIFLFLCILNGIFQGMGAGPAYVLLASWFPRKSRGITTAFFNISHNVGGGLVAPIAGGAIAWLGTEHWQAAHFELHPKSWTPPPTSKGAVFLCPNITYTSNTKPYSIITKCTANSAPQSTSTSHAPTCAVG